MISNEAKTDFEQVIENEMYEMDRALSAAFTGVHLS